MLEELRFLWAYARNPSAVSSVIPTASWNVKKICSTIPDDVRRVIVEYGPGTGVIAKHLLEKRRLTHDSILIMIERDRKLAAALSDEWREDPRARVFADSAENVRDVADSCGVESVDHVITSIPFSKIQREVLARIMEQTHGILKPGGELTAFQVSRKVKDVLRGHGGFGEMTDERLWLNVPPLILARVKKMREDSAPDAPPSGSLFA